MGSPDQPRDDHGRWSSNGGFATTDTAYAEKSRSGNAHTKFTAQEHQHMTDHGYTKVSESAYAKISSGMRSEISNEKPAGVKMRDQVGDYGKVKLTVSKGGAVTVHTSSHLSAQSAVAMGHVVGRSQR